MKLYPIYFWVDTICQCYFIHNEEEYMFDSENFQRFLRLNNKRSCRHYEDIRDGILKRQTK